MRERGEGEGKAEGRARQGRIGQGRAEGSYLAACVSVRG